MSVLIKRYANRKLYNTETSRYITLQGIPDLLELGQEVRVIENDSGEDITSVTLSQILVDTERDGRSVPGCFNIPLSALLLLQLYQFHHGIIFGFTGINVLRLPPEEALPAEPLATVPLVAQDK